MPDLMVKSFYDPVFSFQEIRAGKMNAGRMMGIEITVTRQMLYKSLQLDQHFFLCERSKFTPVCFIKERCARKEHKAAGTDKHRFALTEDLCRMDGMIHAVFLPCNTIEETFPSVDRKPSASRTENYPSNGQKSFLPGDRKLAGNKNKGIRI